MVIWQRYDGSAWNDLVTQGDWQIDYVMHKKGPYPTASVPISKNETVNAGDQIRAREGTTTIFEGYATSGGKYRLEGQRKVTINGYGTRLFADRVTFTETNPTDESVLQAALNNADVGAEFTLDFSITPTTINTGRDYVAGNRPVQAVYRDVMDRMGYTWRIDSSKNIHVTSRGGRGIWKTVEVGTDSVGVVTWDSGNIDTVRNEVTVNGTGETNHQATATDSTSISEYGRRSESYNFKYITSDSDAESMAEELLVPDPLAEGELIVGNTVGNISQDLANYRINVTDASKGIDGETLTIEKATLREGRVDLQVGEGTGFSLDEYNRLQQTIPDITEPGSIMPSERISDEAVLEGKLADLSVSTTKIQDDAITTPKLIAEAVTAAKIQADSITANEIAANTLTANEIDVLNLDTGDITIGSNTATQIEYDVEDISGTLYPVFQPSEDLGANLGFTGNRWRSLRVETITAESISLGNRDIPFFVQPNNSGVPIQILDRNTDPSIEPDGIGVGNVGTSAGYFSEMHATNFVTHSPPSFAAKGVDVRDWDIGSKRLPTEVIAEADSDNPDAENGISMDKLLSMLVSVVQEQADELEDLDARLSKLEAE